MSIKVYPTFLTRLFFLTESDRGKCERKPKTNLCSDRFHVRRQKDFAKGVKDRQRPYPPRRSLEARLRPIQIFWISEPDTEPN